MAHPETHFSLGVDVGGTFTDFVLLDENTGRISIGKVLTTPSDPSDAMVAGTEKLLSSSQVEGGLLTRVVHGTTLVTNTIIERKGVKTGLITTMGYRDTLEIGRALRYDLYDLSIEFAEPLVERNLRLEVDERVGSDGTVLKDLDEAQFIAAAETLVKEGVEALAVVFLHSHRNPLHEQRAQALLRGRYPELPVSISSEVVGELREFDRTSTTVTNAYVLPRMKSYLGRLEARLQKIGVTAPLRLMLSSGGVATGEFGREFPVQMIESGPAGGAIAASYYGRLAGFNDLLSFDMGGTTAKMCLITGGQPTHAHTFEAARVQRFKKGSGLLLRVPVIELIEIGAGGGSIAQVDRMGLIKVGPHSSGAEPGPACYGQGGLSPTVTDADLMLGYLDTDSFLGGRMKLDRSAAESAISKKIAEPVGLPMAQAATGIQQIVDETMASATRVYAAERGIDLRDYTMLAFGGAGPVHAFHLARLLKLKRIICPFGAGAASALGFLVAPASVEMSRSYFVRLADISWPHVRGFLGELKARAEAMLCASGVTASSIVYDTHIEMSYMGQGFEIGITLPFEFLQDAAPADELRRAFEAEYLRLYGRILQGVPMQTVTWRLVARGPAPQLVPVAADAADRSDPLKGRRTVYFQERGPVADVPVYDRYKLGAGAKFAGPAVFEERESTFVVGFDAEVRVDAALNLIAELN